MNSCELAALILAATMLGGIVYALVRKPRDWRAYLVDLEAAKLGGSWRK